MALLAHGEDERDGCYDLVFEYLAGGELFYHMRRRKIFMEAEASQVVRGIARALAEMHRIGLAHRDLKPQNILCERVSTAVPVKVCDLGFVGGRSQILSPTDATRRNSAAISRVHSSHSIALQDIPSLKVQESYKREHKGKLKRCVCRTIQHL